MLRFSLTTWNYLTKLHDSKLFKLLPSGFLICSMRGRGLPREAGGTQATVTKNASAVLALLSPPSPPFPAAALLSPQVGSFSPHQAVAKPKGSPELTFAGGGVFRGRRWGWAARSAWVWSSNGPRILPDVQGEFLLRGLVWNFIENIALTEVHCPRSTGGNWGLNASEGRDPLGYEAAGVSI